MVKAMELQERRSELLFIHLQTSLSLCMGISDKMEFVTIAIYETMSLEIKATIVWIAIPSLTMLVCIEGKAICPKVCQLHIESFCLIIYKTFCFPYLKSYSHCCCLLLRQACQLGF